MNSIVVYEKETKEVIACISLDGKESIVKDGIEISSYNFAEPLFDNEDGAIKLSDAFCIKLKGEDK